MKGWLENQAWLIWIYFSELLVFFLLFLSCYVNLWQSYIISNWPRISNLRLITTPVYGRVNKCSKSYCESILKQAARVHKTVCHSSKTTVHLSSVRKVVQISIESHNDLQRHVNKLKILKFWWRDWLCSVAYNSMGTTDLHDLCAVQSVRANPLCSKWDYNCECTH